MAAVWQTVVLILILVAARAVTSGIEMMAVSGDSITLPCSANPEVEQSTWMFRQSDAPLVRDHVVAISIEGQFFIMAKWKAHAYVSRNISTGVLDLELRNVVPRHHTGEFICSVDARVPPTNQETIYQLVVLAPPSVSPPPTHLKVCQALTLNCTTRSGRSPPKMTWTRNGKIVSNSSATSLRFVPGAAFAEESYNILTLTSLTASDDGAVYSCSAEHTATSGEADWPVKTLVGHLPPLKVPTGVPTPKATEVEAVFSRPRLDVIVPLVVGALGVVVIAILTRRYWMTACRKKEAKEKRRVATGVCTLSKPRAPFEFKMSNNRRHRDCVRMTAVESECRECNDPLYAIIIPRSKRVPPPSNSPVVRQADSSSDTIVPARREFTYSDDLSTARSRDIFVC